MSTTKSSQLYCSVDLEFTGFDPDRDQILEIGFAFFTVTENGAEISEQWSQVFKPSIEVHPKILGLTGITQQELDEAPEFSEFREFLQEKLGDAIIVGHNPVMDVKFLEAYGIKLSGKIVDTLELVQFILPTHHSYNLENLVHYFGVKHHNAHRALGDAISTALVLENLLRVYSGFSEDLKKDLDAIINRGDFFWQELIVQPLNPKQLEQNDSLHHTAAGQRLDAFNLTGNLISIDQQSDDHEARVAQGLKKTKTVSVIAVADSGTVMRLWKEGLVHGVFRADDTFSKLAFEKFLTAADTPEALRFCLKVIVWLHTNWQTEVVLDLNISFFGGQFRQFIVGGKSSLEDQAVLCLDYTTLQTLVASNDDKSLAPRSLVVTDLQNFEKFMSTGFGTRLSWNSVLYTLKLIYNPETDFGKIELKDEVLTAIANTDLFFGLVYMLLHQAFNASPYATVEDIESHHPHVYGRLARSAQNLSELIAGIKAKSSEVDLTRIVNFLGSFFIPAEGRVKWVTVDERNLSFQDQPLDISDNVEKIIGSFDSVQFTETITNPILLSYLVDRLGLHTDISEFTNDSTKLLPSQINIEVTEKKISDSELYSEVTASSLPLVVIFPETNHVKEFYNDNYIRIKEKSALFAQGYSGGGNKMFRNFSIRENSMLLVTADFMAKQNYKIPAQTLIFTAPPSVETNHPYTAALIRHWAGRHADLVLAFQLSKITAAIKKVKIDDEITIKIYNFSEKDIFVDNTR
jgi:DNA polymerase III epsilon subunit-like protein